jgi:hypothetical protein
MLQRPLNLLGQPAMQAIDQPTHIVTDVPRVQVFASAITRVKNLDEVGINAGHSLTARERLLPQVVQVPRENVAIDQFTGDGLELGFGRGEISRHRSAPMVGSISMVCRKVELAHGKFSEAALATPLSMRSDVLPFSLATNRKNLGPIRSSTKKSWSP